ncbi:uncharacterized protein LOC120991076 [Bufo bufo]|uniref:uncharacterized protein LOC120991076 n=1 Tax=Bufo bufo TaxID=8384 RepID=UPI001ABE554C|nr:uncharacterized protein LOC120991076 [Bufo bufo]
MVDVGGGSPLVKVVLLFNINVLTFIFLFSFFLGYIFWETDLILIVFKKMSSYSSESGNSPPRRRVRLETQSSTEERYSGPAPTAGEEEVGGGHHESSNPTVASRGRQQPPTRRRGARGGRGRGSRASARTDEEELSGFYFNNELLIHLVEERVPLWDHTDRRHADHHLTRSLWMCSIRMEICRKMLTDWDDLSEGKQEDCKTAVMVRWRSIRDRYKKDEEVNRPSGSGGTHRQPYRYAAALGFLRRTLELRRTTSSTWAPEPPCESHQEAVPAELPPADPSPPRPAPGQDPNRPLLVPSGDATMAVMAPLFEALMRCQRAGRSRQADYEDLTRLLYETLCGYSNRIVAMEAELRSLRECVAQFSQPGPLQTYWPSVN